jgi:hypothetical protein
VALELTQTEIVNPARQGLIILPSLTLPNGAVSQLGGISPFPPDQPSVYLLPLDERARTALSRGGTVTLNLELRPADASQPLSPALDLSFRVTFRT